MNDKLYTPEELVKKLVDVTGLNQKELADRLGISAQTLSNWSVGRTKYFDPKLIAIIGDAMRQNSRWGIRLGTITRSQIEIVENKSVQPNDNQMANDVIKHYIKYSEQLESKITELQNELNVVKEELHKYKSK